MSSLRSRLQSATGLAKSEAIAVTVISSVLLIGSLGPRLWTGSPRIQSGRDVPQLVDSLNSQRGDRAEVRPRLYTADSHAVMDGTHSGGASVPAENIPYSQRSYVRSSSKPPSSIGTRVNLNTASESRLILVPGIGPATARAIITRRAQRPFHSVDDLLDIRGIGPRKLERMRPYVSAP